MRNNYVIYRMKAKIERGMLQPNKVARKHVRFIRTLDASALELSHVMVSYWEYEKKSRLLAERVQSVDHVWPGKVDYSLSTPTKAVIFGTSIRLDFKVIPLSKEIRIIAIEVRIREQQDFWFGSGRERRYGSRRVHTVEQKWDFPPDAELEETDDGRDGYVFHRMLELPKNLRECRQTVKSKGISIRHYLEFNVRLYNPASYLSEVQGDLYGSY